MDNKHSKAGGPRHNGPRHSGRKPQRPQKVATQTNREAAEIEQLQKRIAEVLPAPGNSEIEFTEFAQMPISRYTLNGLSRAKFTTMTQIQRAAIVHALGGRDILGAAKTGSGKTLAYVVPLLDKLYRGLWTGTDGVGAIVISPTRELALQIFEVVKAVGQFQFSLSAGLITGGKDFAEEQASIGRMALLVATPGRLLQHLEQSPDLDVSGVQMLVLDEADRLLDLGFADTINSILSYLPTPPQRQTLLFSATQTKSVRDLARLSLNAPEFVAVHDKAESATPSRLTQHYVACTVQDKLNLLFSFLRTHTHNKIIIFVSSCKQSRFLFEAFRRLRPGIPLHLLHGKMKQTRRMVVYYDFLKKPSAAMFATDVAARGLDFTGVDWVLQLDCPEDTATYIHRVGRTARFTAKGHALAVLTPSEARVMVPLLTAARVPIVEIRINPNTAIAVDGKLGAEVAADPSLKQLAQRAFLSYLRSVALQRNKDVFNPASIDLNAFAESFGLSSTPDVKLVRYNAPGGEAGSSITLTEVSMLSPEEAEAMRKEAHSRKNSNKALTKLKEKIASEKSARKAAAAAAAIGSRESVSSSGDDSDDDDMLGSDGDSDDEDEADIDDDEEEEAEAGGRRIQPRVDPPKAAHVLPSSAKRPEKPKQKDEDEDDLLVRKKGSNGHEGSYSTMGGQLHVSESDLRGLSDRDRARVLRIGRETREIGADDSKKELGPDGMTPFERIAAAKKAELRGATPDAASARIMPTSKVPLTTAAAAHAAKLAARLAGTSQRDKEADRSRVKEKHRKERMAARGKVEEEEGGDGQSDGAEDEGVRLGGGSVDEQGGSSTESSEEDEQKRKAKGRAMVAVAGQVAGSKRAHDRTVDTVPGANPASSSLEDLEALALQRMGGKGKVKKSRLI